jgi:hypothetical protein
MTRHYKPSDLGEIRLAAWDALPLAFAGAIPFCGALAWVITAYLDAYDSRASMGWHSWAALALASIVAAIAAKPWVRAIKACNEFTRQMKERTAKGGTP